MGCFTAHGIRVSWAGLETIKLEATKSPKWLTITYEKAGKRYEMQAIYKIEGDTFIFCRSA